MGRSLLLAARLLLLVTPACTAANPDFQIGPADAAADTPVGDGSGTANPDFEIRPADTAADTSEGDGSGLADQAPAMDEGPADSAGPDAGAPGAPCSTGASCASGFCVDGVCCLTGCAERCRSCSLPGSEGTCTLVPTEADPRGSCPAEGPATCGRAGGCDGKGDCLLRGPETECRPRSCTAGVEAGPALCNGLGLCNAGTLTTCSLGSCTGDRCAVGCTAASCAPGFACVSGRCEPSGSVLHWRFDDTTGTAADSSGNGFHGSYWGDTALPMPSDRVPMTSFENTRSLFFPDVGGAGVLISNASPLLRPTTTVTVSVWYRATTAGPNVEIVNSGDGYILRLGASHIEFVKRKSMVDGQINAVAAERKLTTHLDGSWHHVAGVISPTAVTLYIKGQLKVSRANTDPILYRDSGLWVGRLPNIGHDFRGNLDDLRIYARDLSEAEIARLAAGKP